MKVFSLWILLQGIFLNDINRGYRAVIVFVAASIMYMAVATYFYYEKVRRTMRTAIVSNLLKANNGQKKIIMASSALFQECKNHY